MPLGIKLKKKRKNDSPSYIFIKKLGPPAETKIAVDEGDWKLFPLELLQGNNKNISS